MEACKILGPRDKDKIPSSLLLRAYLSPGVGKGDGGVRGGSVKGQTSAERGV